MTNLLLIFTVIGLALCAMAMTALLRQVGLISRRLIEAGKGGREPGLTVGTPIPVREFQLADGSGMVGVPPGGRATVLLFASLSCASCRSLLEALHAMDRRILDRTILMLLDSGPWERFLPELEGLRLAEMPVVFANELAVAFEIGMPPQIYLVDGRGSVAYAGRVLSVEELNAAVSGRIGLNRKFSSDGYKENYIEEPT